MGYLSGERLDIMKCQYPFICSNNYFICDTCHLSKQRKLPFPSSKSHVEHSFNLMHIDIWEPCISVSMKWI